MFAVVPHCFAAEQVASSRVPWQVAVESHVGALL
jgi:hypothetical protein